MESLAELPQFLKVDTRLDVKLIALEHILGSTAHSSFCVLLTGEKHHPIVTSFISLLNDPTEHVVASSLSILLNLSADPEACKNILDNIPVTLLTLFTNIINPNSSIADECCKILNNFTSTVSTARKVYNLILSNKLDMNGLVSSFVIQEYNKKKCGLHYLGKVFGNLATLPEFRQFLLDKSTCVIQRLTPFTEYAESSVRREGIVALIKNCCLASTEHHEYLLGEEVDILPKLLLPLAGGEEFSDEDNDSLPIELQYLPADKQREPHPAVRKLLLEILLLLCSKKQNRVFIRDSNSYVILRELHKVEPDKEVLLACENLVDVLIRTEEEIGMDNLNSVEVSKEMEEKFNNMDEEFLKS